MSEPKANDMHFLKHERLSGIQEKLLNNSVKLFSVLYGYHISSAWGIASILYCIVHVQPEAIKIDLN